MECSLPANKRYLIRKYLYGDDEEIVRLLNFILPGWGDLKYWKWLHHDNVLKKNVISLSMIDKKIIGINLSIPLRIKIGERVLNSVCEVIGGIRPDHRRMGVYSKICKFRMELIKKKGIKFFYSYASNPIIIKQYLGNRDYFIFPRPIINYAWIKNIDLHLKKMSAKNAWVKKAGFFALKTISNIRKATNHTKNITDRILISEINSFDTRINSFWEIVSKRYCFIQERSKDYLNWRYCDSRSGSYVIKQIEEGKNILGYIVLSIRTSKVKDYYIGTIVDLLTIPNRIDVVDALVADAINYFISKSINTIECLFAKNRQFANVLKKYGFIEVKHRAYLFCFQSGIDNEIKKIKSNLLDNVHFTYGDTSF
ncbi:MAG: hypothetical protein NWE86_00800 [Candidatus Bathyarchaeota archaeon]|nr:hypothetical protein [Candidatus Bathyarchaeota archaeon]